MGSNGPHSRTSFWALHFPSISAQLILTRSCLSSRSVASSIQRRISSLPYLHLSLPRWQNQPRCRCNTEKEKLVGDFIHWGKPHRLRVDRVCPEVLGLFCCSRLIIRFILLEKKNKHKWAVGYPGCSSARLQHALRAFRSGKTTAAICPPAAQVRFPKEDWKCSNKYWNQYPVKPNLWIREIKLLLRSYG